MSIMEDFIEYGTQKISFHLDYTDRKTLGITVTPEMEVKVKAPIESSLEKIKEKLKKKAPWILKQKQFFLAFHPRPTEPLFINGSTHLYLGRQYRLKHILSKEEKVKLKRGFLEVNASNRSRIETVLNKWYAIKAEKHILGLAVELLEDFTKRHQLKERERTILLRKMSNRWGSCTPKGKIILNPELIKAPKACIEYVIIHELCHLLHHNHNKQFFNLLHKEMNDWEKWKMKLELLLG